MDEPLSFLTVFVMFSCISFKTKSIYFLLSAALIFFSRLSLAVVPSPYSANFVVSLSLHHAVAGAADLEEKLLDDAFTDYSSLDLSYSVECDEVVGLSDLSVLVPGWTGKKKFELVSTKSVFSAAASGGARRSKSCEAIDRLRTETCTGDRRLKNVPDENFTTLFFFLCPSEVGLLKNTGDFDKQQATYIADSASTFVLYETVWPGRLQVRGFKEGQGAKKPTFAEIISTRNKLSLFPNLFLSGELIGDALVFSRKVDVAANTLTPPPLHYFPSSLYSLPKTVVTIPGEDGKNEVHSVAAFKLVYRVEDETVAKIPLLDQLAAEIFTSGKRIGQIHRLSFEIHLISLGIDKSGYVKVTYDRQYNSRKERKQAPKRAAEVDVDEQVVGAVKKRVVLKKTGTKAANSTTEASRPHIDPLHKSVLVQNLQGAAACRQ